MDKITKYSLRDLSKFPISTKNVRFPSVRDGIDNTSIGETFVVIPDGNMTTPGDISFVPLPPFNTPAFITTNGRSIFLFIVETQKVLSINCDNLSETEWEYDTPFDVTNLFCDGDYLYISYQTMGEELKIEKLNSHNGVVVNSITDDHGHALRVCSNSSIVVYITNNGMNDVILAYDNEFNFLWQYVHNGGVSLTDVAMSGKWVAATGQLDDWGRDTVILDLDGNVLWSDVFNSWPQALPPAVFADGDELIHINSWFVGFDVETMTRYVNVSCTNSTNVAWEEQKLCTSQPSVNKILCSGDILYILNGSGIRSYNKYSLSLLWEIPFDNTPAVRDMCTDGHRIYCLLYLGGFDSGIGIIETGLPPKRFVRVSGSDPKRKPFFNLAVPAEEPNKIISNGETFIP